MQTATAKQSFDPILSEAYEPQDSDLQVIQERLHYYEARIDLLLHRDLDFQRTGMDVIDGQTREEVGLLINADKAAVKVLQAHQATLVARPEKPKPASTTQSVTGGGKFWATKSPVESLTNVESLPRSTPLCVTFKEPEK